MLESPAIAEFEPAVVRQLGRKKFKAVYFHYESSLFPAFDTVL